MGRLAIDFDGTLFEGDPYPETGQPLAGAVEAMRQLAADGHDLVIWSGRNNQRLNPGDRPNPGMEKMIAALREHGIPFSEVDRGDQGKVIADVYVDNRGVRFDGDWAQTLAQVRMLMARPMQKGDQIPGGRADKRKPSDFDEEALRQGTWHELEHTDDVKVAREIAMDHLAEDPSYYRKLKKIEKAQDGPYIGPRGGKWANVEHTIPWKPSAPGAAPAAKDDSPATPARRWYGLTYRPPDVNAIPRGEYEAKPHPDFKHGAISYGRELTDDEVRSFQLTPILTQGEIAARVSAAASELLADYPDEQRELARDDPSAFSLGAEAALDDQGLGHLGDKSAVVEAVRQRVLSKSVRVRAPGSHGSTAWHYDSTGNVVYGAKTAQGRPRDPRLFQLLERKKVETAEIKRHVAAGVHEFSNKDGDRHAFLTRDASEPGKWRFGVFDSRGFMGHDSFDTKDAAIEGMRADGFLVPAKGILDKLAATEEWDQGTRDTAMIQIINTMSFKGHDPIEVHQFYNRHGASEEALAVVRRNLAQLYAGKIPEEIKKGSRVVLPGSRGATEWYRDAQGNVIYGHRPQPREHSHESAQLQAVAYRNLVVKKLGRRGKGQGREVTLSRGELNVVLDAGRYALVSAGKNPKLEQDMTPAAEKARHEKLRAQLVEDGYAFTEVDGYYEGHEKTFLVMIHDTKREYARQLGRQYNQDSVIYSDGQKNEMHFTTGEKAGRMHAGERWENKPDATDYYTVVKHPDGTQSKFALNFDWSKLEEARKALDAFIAELLQKDAGAPYYGPKGGMYEDPEHTQPYRGPKKQKTGKPDDEGGKKIATAEQPAPKKRTKKTGEAAKGKNKKAPESQEWFKEYGWKEDPGWDGKWADTTTNDPDRYNSQGAQKASEHLLRLRDMRHAGQVPPQVVEAICLFAITSIRTTATKQEEVWPKVQEWLQRTSRTYQMRDGRLSVGDKDLRDLRNILRPLGVQNGRVRAYKKIEGLQDKFMEGIQKFPDDGGEFRRWIMEQPESKSSGLSNAKVSFTLELLGYSNVACIDARVIQHLTGIKDGDVSAKIAGKMSSNEKFYQTFEDALKRSASYREDDPEPIRLGMAQWRMWDAEGGSDTDHGVLWKTIAELTGREAFAKALMKALEAAGAQGQDDDLLELLAGLLAMTFEEVGGGAPAHDMIPALFEAFRSDDQAAQGQPQGGGQAAKPAGPQVAPKPKVPGPIAKAAGDRGGKVIGYTRTGKPIYERHDHEAHRGFSKEDHTDAAALHDDKFWQTLKAHHGYHAASHLEAAGLLADGGTRPTVKKPGGGVWHHLDGHPGDGKPQLSVLPGGKKSFDKSLPMALAVLPETTRESLCVNCGLCCIGSVGTPSGQVFTPELMCKHLEFRRDEEGIQRSHCNVYNERHEVAQGWCHPMGDALAKGLLPGGCPYTYGVAGYQGPTVLAPDEYRRVKPLLIKAMSPDGSTPPWADEEPWRAYLLS